MYIYIYTYTHRYHDMLAVKITRPRISRGFPDFPPPRQVPPGPRGTTPKPLEKSVHPGDSPARPFCCIQGKGLQYGTHPIGKP